MKDKPDPISLNQWIWIKVATNVLIGNIIRLNTLVYYYQTWRKTGLTAPPVPTIGIIPEEAAIMFQDKDYEKIESPKSVDVYIMVANKKCFK